MKNGVYVGVYIFSTRFTRSVSEKFTNDLKITMMCISDISRSLFVGAIAFVDNAMSPPNAYFLQKIMPLFSPTHSLPRSVLNIYTGSKDETLKKCITAPKWLAIRENF